MPRPGERAPVARLFKVVQGAGGDVPCRGERAGVEVARGDGRENEALFAEVAGRAKGFEGLAKGGDGLGVLALLGEHHPPILRQHAHQRVARLARWSDAA